MTILPPHHGDTGPPQGSRLEEMSPGFMAIDNTENATAKQRFLVKFQYKPISADQLPTNHPAPTDPIHHTHITTTMLLISKLRLQFGNDLSVLALDNTMIDLQALTNNAFAEFSKKFKYVHRPNAARPHEVWLTVDTTLTFGAIKRQLITWLQEKDMWMDLHGFGIQVLRTFNLGYLLAFEPRHIFRVISSVSTCNRASIERLPTDWQNCPLSNEQLATSTTAPPTPLLIATLQPFEFFSPQLFATLPTMPRMQRKPEVFVSNATMTTANF